MLSATAASASAVPDHTPVPMVPTVVIVLDPVHVLNAVFSTRSNPMSALVKVISEFKALPLTCRVIGTNPVKSTPPTPAATAAASSASVA